MPKAAQVGARETRAKRAKDAYASVWQEKAKYCSLTWSKTILLDTPLKARATQLTIELTGERTTFISGKKLAMLQSICACQVCNVKRWRTKTTY